MPAVFAQSAMAQLRFVQFRFTTAKILISLGHYLTLPFDFFFFFFQYSKHDPTLVRPKLMQSLFGVLESQLHQPMKGNGRVGIASSEESSDSEDLLPRDMKGRRGAISGAALIASPGTGDS